MTRFQLVSFRFKTTSSSHAPTRESPFLRARQALVICVLGTISLNCLTNMHSKSLSEYANARREFDTEIVAGHVGLAKGVVYQEGSKVIAVFPDTLRGSRRLLQIEGESGSLRLREVSSIPTGDRALILRQNVCCMEDAAFRAVVFAEPGQRITVDQIVREKFQIKDMPASSALAVLDFANVYTVSGHLLMSENGAIKSVSALVPGPYDNAMAEIDWSVRNRPVFILLHLGYAVTLPLDVVTSPFQLVALLLMPLGAK